MMTYEWVSSSDVDGAVCELRVELSESMGDACPTMELSHSLIRIEAAAGSSLCLPLPVPGCAILSPRWARKRRVLTVRFVGEQSPLVPSMALGLATELRANGWCVLDAFLPGAEADELRQCILRERDAGRLKLGQNRHEGPINKHGATKNDLYAFVPSDG